MKLITKEILKKLPGLYANEDKETKDIKIPLKLFNPCGSQTWYITEYDEKEELAFGYVTGMGSDELGYVSIKELKSLRLPYGLSIERDMYWNGNTTLDEIM